MFKELSFYIQKKRLRKAAKRLDLYYIATAQKCLGFSILTDIQKNDILDLIIEAEQSIVWEIAHGTVSPLKLSQKSCAVGTPYKYYYYYYLLPLHEKNPRLAHKYAVEIYDSILLNPYIGNKSRWENMLSDLLMENSNVQQKEKTNRNSYKNN